MTLPTVDLMQSVEVGQPFHRNGWVYEEKYDGWRVVAYKDGTDVKLVSRAGKEQSRQIRDAGRRDLRPPTHELDSRW